MAHPSVLQRVQEELAGVDVSDYRNLTPSRYVGRVRLKRTDESDDGLASIPPTPFTPLAPF